MKTVMLVAFLAVVMFQTALVSGATTESAWDSGASTTMVSVMALLLPVVAALFRLQ